MYNVQPEVRMPWHRISLHLNASPLDLRAYACHSLLPLSYMECRTVDGVAIATAFYCECLFNTFHASMVMPCISTDTEREC